MSETKIVPKEPTEEMEAAFWDAYDDCDLQDFTESYKAMLEAAPDDELTILRCPDNAGGFHTWNEDGQCKSCCNYATDLLDAALIRLRENQHE